MAKDPVCGMDVDERFTQIQVGYLGKVHFFCSPACREVFERNPNRFLEQKEEHASSRRKAAA